MTSLYFATDAGNAEAAADETKKSKSNEVLNDCDELVEENGLFSAGWQRRSSFDLDQLVGVVRDLFVAGAETTATTLTWIVLYLSKYPEIQSKMQSEIDDILDENSFPQMAMMEKMPYVRAVIQVSETFYTSSKFILQIETINRIRFLAKFDYR